MSTNSVASAAELEVIKQWLKKTAGLGESIEVEPHLPQSKSFSKILGVPYWDSKSSLPITPAQVEAALSNSPLFKDVSLASMSRIMKASPSSDMSVIWIDIWDSQKGSKGKTLIIRSFNFGHHTATVRGTAMHPGIAQYRNCWYWGHPIHACHAQGAKYQKCGSPHRVENHRLLAWCCKANTKSDPPREATAAGAPCPHTFAGQALMDLAESYSLMHSILALSVPTHYSDISGHANSVIDLIFFFFLFIKLHPSLPLTITIVNSKNPNK